MDFANRQYIALIYASAVALTVFYVWAMMRRSVLMERFTDKSLMNSIAPTASPIMKALKCIVIMTAALLALIALARPQWGFLWEETKRTGIDILMAIDVSRSMLATDVKPNRLERSKFAVKDLVKKLNGDRVGLIAFSGTSFIQCPLTIDYNGFLLALDDLNVGTIPRGGTSMTSAIRESMGIFKGPDKKYKVLVIITDGEDLEGDALKVAKEAGDLGIKIYCVGVGSSEGDLIPEINDRGDKAYVTDRAGQVVNTRLNEDLLKKIAISTGANYVHAGAAEFGLVLLYDKSISKLEKRDIEAKMRKRSQEQFQYFLVFAVILLLLEPLLPDRRMVSR